ncbi:PIN domain-containing protein [Brevibacterium luteolum]|uniref:Ribonuclease VapC n=1 Tax=Brevibacterium luteolum TaxID=199591 RepID=A0A849AVS4_9MICO|nr:putative nucleic acid-binding protein [Brevibacterium luteolum]NNG79922.1 type II toxin-antitoxin system VapC family toxin [Brevibacterium luteolum]
MNARVVYVDTSALAALLKPEPQSESLERWLDDTSATLVSSILLETELRRVAVRDGLSQTDVTALLDGVALASLDRAVFRNAGFLPMEMLRTLDALHLEAAIRLDADAILTYDHRLAQAAESAGLTVIAPGR